MEDVIDVQRFTVKTKDYLYLCVLDGHGGVDAASEAHTLLYEKLLAKISSTTGDINWTILLCTLFEEVNDALSKKVNAWPQKPQGYVSASGCTCTVVVIEENTSIMHWANVGDSRALLCNNQTCKTSTCDHRVSIREERERLVSLGAECVYRNGSWWITGPRQPDAPHMSGRYVYLQLSRGLGDFWSYLPHKDVHLVSPTPSVQHMKFEDQDTMIVASDGLWDTKSNRDVMKRIVLKNDSGLALSRIVEEIKMEGNVRDNISIIVVRKDT